jgi:hypothetical protein
MFDALTPTHKFAHTHTHLHIHTLSLSLSYTHTHTFPLSLSRAPAPVWQFLSWLCSRRRLFIPLQLVRSVCVWLHMSMLILLSVCVFVYIHMVRILRVYMQIAFHHTSTYHTHSHTHTHFCTHKTTLSLTLSLPSITHLMLYCKHTYALSLCVCTHTGNGIIFITGASAIHELGMWFVVSPCGVGAAGMCM